MAHIWLHDVEGASRWSAGLLGASRYQLIRDSRGAVKVRPTRHLDAESIWIVRQDGTNRQEQWLLLAGGRSGASLRCNGVPLYAGIRVLRDRDEILLPGCPPAYFGTEQLSRVVPCVTEEEPVVCPRCRREVSGPAVQCPNPDCGAWYHQSRDQQCWTGDTDADQSPATCARCGRLATLYADESTCWTPEWI